MEIWQDEKDEIKILFLNTGTRQICMKFILFTLLNQYVFMNPNVKVIILLHFFKISSCIMPLQILWEKYMLVHIGLLPYV